MTSFERDYGVIFTSSAEGAKGTTREGFSTIAGSSDGATRAVEGFTRIVAA